MVALLSGYWISHMLRAVTRLGAIDALGKKSLAAAELAEKTGVNAAYLRRVLRALATVGVFAEDAKGRFKATPLGRTLASDQPRSLHDYALMSTDDYNVEAWQSLEECVKVGRTAFDLQHGMPIFEYLRVRPEKDQQFSRSMASISAPDSDAVAQAYPFGRHKKLVDVGGAHGHLLAAILRRHKKVRGVLYDQPQVVASAGASGFVTADGVRERCEIAGGSFFDSVPAGADAYLMKYVLHDWDDAKCSRILSHCRKAMAPGGRVLIVERVIRPGNEFDWSKWLDVNMMVVPGGLERTEREFRELLASAGLELVKVHRTRSPLSILEARAAE